MLCPRVVVGGYPNSGTSFLCHLVHKMGVSAGPEQFLKKADKHNRWGYWECLPIRTTLWGQLPYGCRVEHPDQIPDRPLPADTNVALAIEMFGQEHNVEVYKDNLLPLIYRMLPLDAKYVVIMRVPRECYMSPARGGIRPYEVSFEDFSTAVYKYYELAKNYLDKDRDVIYVTYDGFHAHFGRSVGRIAEHIGVDLRDEQYAELREIFRPRED